MTYLVPEKASCILQNCTISSLNGISSIKSLHSSLLHIGLIYVHLSSKTKNKKSFLCKCGFYCFKVCTTVLNQYKCTISGKQSSTSHIRPTRYKPSKLLDAPPHLLPPMSAICHQFLLSLVQSTNADTR